MQHFIIPIMNVKQIRKMRGLNQEELADLMSASQATISNIENGFDGVTLRQLRKCAEVLDVPIHALLTEDVDVSEQILIDIFRALPDDRKRGWLDMATLAKAEIGKEGR